MTDFAAALADRYRVERELGRGGMATVYLAHDLRHDRPVALKVLRPELAASLGPERFLQEIRIAARLQHPHILPVHDSGGGGGPAVVHHAVRGRGIAPAATGARRPDVARPGGENRRPGPERAGVRPCPRRDPPRHQAREHSDGRGRGGGGVFRGGAGHQRRRRRPASRDRFRPRHAHLHEPGAGRRQPGPGRAQRPVCDRLRAVRDARGPAAVAGPPPSSCWRATRWIPCRRSGPCVPRCRKAWSAASCGRSPRPRPTASRPRPPSPRAAGAPARDGRNILEAGFRGRRRPRARGRGARAPSRSGGIPAVAAPGRRARPGPGRRRPLSRGRRGPGAGLPARRDDRPGGREAHRRGRRARRGPTVSDGRLAAGREFRGRRPPRACRARTGSRARRRPAPAGRRGGRAPSRGAQRIAAPGRRGERAGRGERETRRTACPSWWTG